MNLNGERLSSFLSDRFHAQRFSHPNMCRYYCLRCLHCCLYLFFLDCRCTIFWSKWSRSAHCVKPVRRICPCFHYQPDHGRLWPAANNAGNDGNTCVYDFCYFPTKLARHWNCYFPDAFRQRDCQLFPNITGQNISCSPTPT